MNQKFKIGDKVILKTGSPKMTIINDKLGDDPELGYIFEGTYRCAWFDDTREFKEKFHQDALYLAFKKCHCHNPFNLYPAEPRHYRFFY